MPGGTAAYPSSVLMNAVPAKVAGCRALVMVVPAPDGKLSPLVLAAAKLAGVDEIYRIGGAQAVAALAYGTETIKPVAKIVGPGNAYVAAAKRLVFGTVGIDMIAGPSEVLILADKTGNPDWIAADLLAQAEHDAERAVDPDHRRCRARRRGREGGRRAAHDVAARHDRRRLVARFRRHHPGGQARRRDPAGRSTRARASGDRRRRCRDAGREIRNAGAIFIGAHTPEAIGDYVAGSNHVLPTARSARFSSGLGVLDFMKRTSILKCGPRAVARARPRRDRARRGGGARRPCPLGRDPPEPAMSPAKATPAATKQRLVAVTLDEESIGRSNPDVEHERAVAIYDLLEQNIFAPVGHDGGPYALHLSINGNRLVFDIRLRGRHAGDGASVLAHAAAPHRQGLLHDLRQLL